jgi:hypothetical protein
MGHVALQLALLDANIQRYELLELGLGDKPLVPLPSSQIEFKW